MYWPGGFPVQAQGRLALGEALVLACVFEGQLQGKEERKNDHTTCGILYGFNLAMNTDFESCLKILVECILCINL